MTVSTETLMALATWTPALFVFAVGACVGSLVNVLVYRLPLGLPVVLPSSRCPMCETTLTWRENIPILGWLLLRGRCRFCRCPISAEYPLVELFVGMLFLAFYVVWYIPGLSGLDLGLRTIQPEWARNGLRDTWPAFAALLILIGCLVAMTIVDFKTYTIPLVLTWVPVGAALVLHPVNAWIVGDSGLRYHATDLGGWIIASPGQGTFWWTGAAAGAALGLLLSWALVSRGLIGRSFADYEAWETKALAEAEANQDSTGESETPEMWIQYPHARREMVRELAYLAAPIALGWFGGSIAARLADSQQAAPLWLEALAAVAMGYLIGGAIVWGVRIFGTFLFGKEAMGLGDVHLLAAIGAVMGWADAVLTFFAAVLVGLVAAGISAIRPSQSARVLAFGPCLAIGAVLVLLGKPAIEAALTGLFSLPETMNLP